MTPTTSESRILSDREALEALRLYNAHNLAARNSEHQASIPKEKLKEYIEARGPIYDEETGLRAKLRVSHGAPVYDTVNLPPALIEWAHRAGALRLDPKVLTALREAFPVQLLELARYAVPGPETTALVVTKDKE